MVILSAVDGEQVPSEVVETGQSLATQYNEEHVVIHVMPQELFEEFRASAGTPKAGYSLASPISYGGSNSQPSGGSSQGYTIEDGERHARGVAEDVIDETLDGTDGVTPQGRVGDPVEEVMAEANRRNARYLVIGGRKRTPVGKAMFGSTTQSILLTADIPVMTVIDD